MVERVRTYCGCVLVGGRRMPHPSACTVRNRAAYPKGYRSASELLRGGTQVRQRTSVLEALRETGARDDKAIDIADTALLLAAADRPDEALEPYREALAEIARDAQESTARSHSVDMQTAALTNLLVGRRGFRGDTETYDDPRNANLMHVIDRRRGLPVALGILWMHAARAYGGEIVGLAFPSHFLIRLFARGQRLILDAFGGGRSLGAE